MSTKTLFTSLFDQLMAISPQIPLPLRPQHIQQLTHQLLYYHQHQTLKRPPYFDEECTPNQAPIIAPVYEAFCHWLHNKPQGKLLLTQMLINTNINQLLLILGQRRTSASIATIDALPPERAVLQTTFNTYHKQTLSVGARAWCKHVTRSSEAFWGKVKGNDEVKNKMAYDTLNHILDNATWWNVFEHYKHHLVYEVRLASGHGARWTLDKMRFIGFLEPFINEA
jgi:hypothetical protein